MHSTPFLKQKLQAGCQRLILQCPQVAPAGNAWSGDLLDAATAAFPAARTLPIKHGKHACPGVRCPATKAAAPKTTGGGNYWNRHNGRWNHHRQDSIIIIVLHVAGRTFA